MTKKDKFARWGDKRLKWERETDRLMIMRNSEGVHHEDAAVYIRNRELIGFTLNVSEAREVAAAIIAAADEFELILAEPDVIAPSIREQVVALPVGSTFRVVFRLGYSDEDTAEYVRTATGLFLYLSSGEGPEHEYKTAELEMADPLWSAANGIEILHLAD